MKPIVLPSTVLLAVLCLGCAGSAGPMQRTVLPEARLVNVWPVLLEEVERDYALSRVDVRNGKIETAWKEVSGDVVDLGKAPGERPWGQRFRRRVRARLHHLDDGRLEVALAVDLEQQQTVDEPVDASLGPRVYDPANPSDYVRPGPGYAWEKRTVWSDLGLDEKATRALMQRIVDRAR